MHFNAISLGISTVFSPFGFSFGLENKRVRSVFEHRDEDNPGFNAQNYIISGQGSHPAVFLKITPALFRFSPAPYKPGSTHTPQQQDYAAQHLALVTSFSDELQLIFHIIPPSGTLPQP